MKRTNSIIDFWGCAIMAQLFHDSLWTIPFIAGMFFNLYLIFKYTEE